MKMKKIMMKMKRMKKMKEGEVKDEEDDKSYIMKEDIMG